MKRRYNKIMEHIEVTPEMRQRVLERIQEKAVTFPPRKALFFPAWKKILSVAACFVLLLMGAVMLPHMLQGEVADPPDLSGSGIEEASSLQELAGWVGFEITESFNLPSEPSDTFYVSYWRELAQIEYRSGEQSAIFRKSAGKEDNSGDYSEYANIEEIQTGDHTVMLKGNDGKYSLAVWTDGEFSYSLSMSPAMGETEWEAVLTP